MPEISLENKKILVVDDEPDVLEAIEDVLYMCTVVKAGSFGEASQLIDTQDFDIAILDIMGVDGYELLKKTRKKNIVSVMLTAHALSPDNIRKSYEGGADSYIPKEEMINIESYLVDVLQAREEGKNPWTDWYGKLASFLTEKFGPEWDKDDEEFWKKMTYH